MEIAAIVYGRRGVQHLEHRPSDQIPPIGQGEREYRLKLKVGAVPFRLVQPVGILLKLQRPDARNRVGQFFVNFVERFAIRCLRHRRRDNRQRQNREKSKQTHGLKHFLPNRR
jgi:hypothetical protein